MFTKIENKYGIISFNERLLKTTVDAAISSFGGKVSTKSLDYVVTPDGVYLELGIQIAFGESISQTTAQLANLIADSIENSMELGLNNVVIKVVSVASKKAVRRNIVYDYARSKLSYN